MVYFLPTPKSPHGCDVDPTGEYIVGNGKLSADLTVHSFTKMLDAIENKKFDGEGRMVWNITTDEGAVVQNQQNSSVVYNYYEMGLLKFEKSGKHTITVSLVDGKRSSASLKQIRLTPEGSME